MIRLGYKLSYSARLSRKNSGLNNKLRTPICARMCWENPTGTVDLITSMASGFASMARPITFSTAEVSK